MSPPRARARDRSLPRHLSSYLQDEDASTARLVRELRPARRRGYLTRSELAKACSWKSPRAIRHVRRNSPAAVRAATAKALRSRSEPRRMAALLRLEGVSVPSASAVLMLLDPRRYGVIDIRVWQLLHRSGYVSGRGTGVGLTVAHWLQFLDVLRGFASRLGVSARRAELALFELHRRRQRGTLYKDR
jgi:hypothetical protein